MDHEVERKRSTPTPKRAGKAQKAPGAAVRGKTADPPDEATLARWFRELSPKQVCPEPDKFYWLKLRVESVWSCRVYLVKEVRSFPTREAALVVFEAAQRALRFHESGAADARAQLIAGAPAYMEKPARVHARNARILRVITRLLPEATEIFGGRFGPPLLQMKADADAEKAGGPKRKRVIRTGLYWHDLVVLLACDAAWAWSTVSDEPMSARPEGRLVRFLKKILESLPNPVFRTESAIGMVLNRRPEWTPPRGKSTKASPRLWGPQFVRAQMWSSEAVKPPAASAPSTPIRTDDERDD